MKANSFIGDGSGLTGINNSSQWLNGTGGIYYNGGNVGIGTTTPNQPLVISDSTDVYLGHILVSEKDGKSQDAVIGLATPTLWEDASIFLDYHDYNKLKFALGNVDHTANRHSSTKMTIQQDGKIGIGTTNPNSQLQVTGGDVYIENINSGVIMKSPDGSCWRMTVDNNGQPVFTKITCP